MENLMTLKEKEDYNCLPQEIKDKINRAFTKKTFYENFETCRQNIVNERFDLKQKLLKNQVGEDDIDWIESRVFSLSLELKTYDKIERHILGTPVKKREREEKAFYIPE